MGCGQSSSSEVPVSGIPSKRFCHPVISPQDSPSEVHRVQVFLSQNGGLPVGSHRVFSTEKVLQYNPFCDDFGPMNLLSNATFVEILDQQIVAASQQQCSTLVYCAGGGPRELTNAAFLLGAYMLFKYSKHPRDIWKRFSSLDEALFEEYRDATFLDCDFRLSLLDCWHGLHQARSLGWIAPPPVPGGRIWGQIDLDTYAYYDNPLIADLHMVVPGKYIAFCGPADPDSDEYAEAASSDVRYFAAEHYAAVFRDMGVATVVRLCEPKYDRGIFLAQGLEHLDLFFEDCTPPPAEVVERFLAASDAAAGRLVAVHCRAGLGRTGTLIAVDMMRTYGFTAPAAVAWLRVMRPGSVIGAQQEYLHAVEPRYRRAGSDAPPPLLEAPEWEPPAGCAAVEARQPVLAGKVLPAPGKVQPTAVKARPPAVVIEVDALSGALAPQGDSDKPLYSPCPVPAPSHAPRRQLSAENLSRAGPAEAAAAAAAAAEHVATGVRGRNVALTMRAEAVAAAKAAAAAVQAAGGA